MWEFFRPVEDRWQGWRLNGAYAFLRKSGEEWRSLFLPVGLDGLTGDSGGPEPADPPGDSPAPTIMVASGERAALRPHWPERPYLIAARNVVHLAGGATARFRVQLPCAFRFELERGSGGAEILAAALPHRLSNTWFGDRTAGSLCYSLRLDLDPVCLGETAAPPAAAGKSAGAACLVDCELAVRNEARTPLEVRFLAVYTELLSIYERAGRLVASPAAIVGLADGSLHMDAAPLAWTVGDGPDFARLLAPARVSQGGRLIRRGVAFLRAIAGL